MAVGTITDAPLLIAPMGASAILLFAVPASPLAQPWPVIGGHMVAALVGVTIAHLVGTPMLAAPLAVALSFGAMTIFRCVHPPSGAIALIRHLYAKHTIVMQRYTYMSDVHWSSESTQIHVMLVRTLLHATGMGDHKQDTI